ncbi:MAG TPA: hypothetical protein VFA11_15160 [Acidimicrobiales bacterium]|nr:hypothetical protein [Acidimicrobiales bacterium]
MPAKITPAYVQRVLNALETVNGESLRLILSQHAFPAGAAVLLRAINTPDEFQRQTGLWGQEIAQGLKNYKANPGVVHDQLARELSANPQCIFTQVNRDFSAVAVTSPPPHITFIELRSKDPSQDPEHVNPTPWVFAFVGFSSTGGQPADPCAST